MIELPEATVISNQINEVLKGKKIKNAIRGQTPHTFMFPMEPEKIPDKYKKDGPQLGGEFIGDAFTKALIGKTIKKSWSNGNVIFVQMDQEFTLSLGVGGEKIIYHEQEKTLPKKHQLILEFDDQTFLTVTISGWGEVRLLETRDVEKHPHVGYNKIDPLTEEFSLERFEELINQLPLNRKCNAKKFFITDPGLRGIGNGVIQDIFFKSKIHPARDMKTLTKEEIELLFKITKEELQMMVKQGGRDSEKNLFDMYGNYERIMHSKSAGTPCPNCHSLIEKKQYGGGSIYFCPSCQNLD
jgi:formamidopyrimidine-DNA glycosylase